MTQSDWSIYQADSAALVIRGDCFLILLYEMIVAAFIPFVIRSDCFLLILLHEMIGAVFIPLVIRSNCFLIPFFVCDHRQQPTASMWQRTQYSDGNASKVAT